ncbi:bidirectional sugar transporter SWEET10-like [Pistacia vera]|uniref:bidirectional sugar transporter SWEET10-like n=1 Tax=Pistacia vera TaxID=55513 RepID=UPI001263B3D3|nr:bidirectional sugar transporter SWEET10-like [Pistacia vera]
MAIHLSGATAFGLLGNIISFLVCLAPLPTFYQIYKKKSTEGFQSVPYVIALFSAMLWIYYALLKENAMLLITINTFSCVIETGYIAVYLFYAPKKARIVALKLVLLFNVFGYGVICLVTLFLAKGANRIKILGYICMAFALSVFVAPLCIVRKVIRTKSAEFMPFPLSFFLTLGAVMWFFYGLLIRDLNVAIPNVLGFIFGVFQMVLYMIYKNPKKVLDQQPKLQELSEHIVDIVKLSTIVCSELALVVPPLNAVENEVIIEDQTIGTKQIEEITRAKQIMDPSTEV